MNVQNSHMAGIWLENRDLRLRNDIQIPKPAPHEALVRVTLAGICSTDLEIVKGYSMNYKGVLGHEFVGVVESAPDPTWIGKRVTSTINFGCHTCPECLAHGTEHCPNRTVLGIINKNGIFAQYVTVDQANLIPIPDQLPDERAVFTEPLAAALRIREQLRVKPSDHICVVGPGRLGMLIGKALSLAGTQVTMAGRREASLELARSWGLNTALIDDLPTDGFQFVVESTGNAAGLEHALRITRPRGTIVLKSTFAGAPAVDLTKVVVAELTVVGSRCGPFEPAIRLLEAGIVPVGDMIEGEYAITKGVQAFEHAAQPGVRKILLKM